jgi:nucleoid-associated protein YgaU
MSDLPDPVKGGKKKDKTQLLLVAGTVILIAIGYIALKRGGGSSGGATPTQTGAESGGTTGEQTTDQSKWDSLNGKLADLANQIKGLTPTGSTVPPTGGSTGTTGGTPAVHPVGSGSTTAPGSALRKLVTKPVTAGKRAGSVQPGAGASSSSHSYTVRQGDTLSAIAKQFGTTWQKLYEANQTTIKTTATTHGQFNAKDPGHWIYGGEKLAIPGHPASKAGTSTAETTHATPTVPVTKAHPTQKG